MDLSDLSGVVERALGAGFDGGSAERLYELEGPVASGLLLESWLAHEPVSAPFVLRLLCLSANAHLDPAAMLAQPIQLHTTLADGSRTSRSALVLEAEPLASNGAAARYRLTAGPWLSLLAYARHSRVWQDRTPVQILEDVFSAYAAHAAWRFDDSIQPDLQASPSAGVRGLRVQYRETDLDFVQRLLATEGWSTRFEEDDTAPAGHRLVIFADSASQPEDATSAHDGGIRFHRSSSQEASDAIQAWGGQRQLGVAQTTWLAWDAYAQRAVTASAPAAAGNLADHAPRIERYEVLSAAQALSGDLFGPAGDALQRRATLQAQAQDARAKTWLARSSVRTLRAGTRFTLTQSALDALSLLDTSLLDAPGAPKPADRTRFFVTDVRHLGINNLPREFARNVSQQLGNLFHHGSAAQSTQSAHSAHDDFTEHNLTDLFAAPPADSMVPGLDTALALDATTRDALVQQAQRSGYANAFSAQRASVPWRPLAPPPRRAPGLQTAVVVGAQAEREPVGQAVHTDALGRVRVRFHWQDAPEAAALTPSRADNQLSCWVRVAQRWAGPGASSQFVPRLGMEVLLTFIDGDIEQPLVTGCVYNGQGEAGEAPTPGGAGQSSDTTTLTQSTDHRASGQGNRAAGNSPVWHGAGASEAAQRNAAALSGIRSQAFDGDAGHTQLLFDDSPQQLAVQAGTTQSATWLNLGHLIHRADNHRGSLRGQGFELRTDAFGAVRGAQGVLLTSYALNPSQGAGHNDAQVALAQQAQALTEALQRATHAHQTVTLASAVGSTGVNQTTLDDHEPPLSALRTSLSGHVRSEALDAARGSALDKHTQPSDDNRHVPHTADPLIAVSAQASLVQTAAQDLIVSAGDVLHLGSGADTQVASGGALRLHAGQALGVLGGAIDADGQRGGQAAGSGLTLIAAQGEVKLQAQSGPAQLAAQQDLRIQTASGEINLAAAQTLTLSTAGGARITLANGQLTVQCPGTVTVKAGNKVLVGGGSVNVANDAFAAPAPLAQAPKQHATRILITDEDGYVLPDRPYRLWTADGRVFEGVTDGDGLSEELEADEAAVVRVELLKKMERA